jgi:lysophospholipase L1-like esterase
MSNRILLRGAAMLAIISAAACTDKTAKVLGPRPSQGNGIFQSYVALGNSITAGYQSGGINDSTQKRSYAVLLAAQMGTRFAYASIANPGCPPPIDNFATQHRVTPTGFPASTGNSCFLRSGTAAILNSVAVPGATSGDPDINTPTPASNLLTQLILGGESQVQRAREANPTFATMWIGNNDVLQPALVGLLASVTPQATFQSNYDKLVADLTKDNTNLKGVLIGVANVADLPLLFTGRALQNPQFVAALSAAAGKTVTPDLTTCTATTSSLVSFLIVSAIASNQHPAQIACEKKNDPTFPLLGDIYVLDSGELATLGSYLSTINGYISSKAQSIGFAYYDPNIALDSLRANGEISSVGPNLNAPTAAFGKWITLDGVHPSSAAHVLLMNHLIDVINAKYSTTLTKLPNP